MPQFSPGLTDVNSPQRISLRSRWLSNSRMATVDEIRHANFLRLLDERCGKKQTEMGRKLGYSAAQVSQLVNQSKHSKTGKPRQIGPSIARSLEKAFELPRGWMDVEHGTSPKSGASSTPAVSAILPTTVPHALATLRDALRALSPSARKNAAVMLRELAEDPADDQKLEILRVIFGAATSEARQVSGGG